MTLTNYLEKAGYTPVDPDYYAKIRLWKDWYRGHVNAFHNYTIRKRGETLNRTRATLNMAKQGCEYWANLLWNGQCYVNLDDREQDEFLSAVLSENDFTRQLNILIEQTWALGSGALVPYRDGKRTRIDFLTAEYIYPLSWRNDDIESCAFAGTYCDGGQEMLSLMIHECQPDGTYLIYNRFFRVSDNGKLTPAPTPDGVCDCYPSKRRRFAILKPNIANNLHDVPFGLSIYANTIDTLKAIDLAYDGAKTAMEIGRPRIGVSGNMLVVNPDTGHTAPVFDANDIAVYDMGLGGPGESVEVRDLTTPYRAAEFERSLQTQLTIFSQAIGLGEKAFLWQTGSSSGVTATQVISENSAMLRTKEKHQEGLRSGIVTLVRAILEMNGIDSGQKITVAFDDSITRDRGREAQEAWQWVLAGQYPFWRYLVDFKGYDLSDALDIAGVSPAPSDDGPGGEQDG